MHTASPVLALGLVALAAAAPALTTRQVPLYPPSSVSKGFRFIANVTDPSRDLTPSVDGWALGGIHIGPPFSRAVLAPQADNTSRLFYLNGTAADVASDTTGLLSDGGTPVFPWGVHVQGPDEFDTPANPSSHATFINGGAATTDVGITEFPNPYSYARNRKAAPGGSFVACNHVVPYYGSDRTFVVVDFAYATTDPATNLPVLDVPAGCAPIALIPQCDVLNDLPADAISSHEFALDQKCYYDVADINWSVYSS